MKRHKLHYAWIILASACILNIAARADAGSFGVFVEPLVDLFGASAPLGTIYSFQMVGAGTGMALGGWLGGFLFDLSGAYTWSVVAAIVTTCVGLPLALALPRHRKPPAAGPTPVPAPVAG